MSEPNAKHVVDVVLEGESGSISLATTNADEWMELIVDLQSAVESLTRSRGESLDDDAYFAVVGLEDNCISAKLELSMPAFESTAVIEDGLRTDNASLWDPKTYQTLKGLEGKVDRKNVQLSVRSNRGNRHRVSFEISRSHRVPDRPSLRTKSQTHFVGRCTRVNLDKPDATIRLLNEDDERLTLDGLDESMTRRLGEHLGELVRVHGVAVWSEEDWSIEKFKVDRFETYEPTGTRLFDGLAEVSGGVWDEVDASEFVNGLRDRGDE